MFTLNLNSNPVEIQKILVEEGISYGAVDVELYDNEDEDFSPWALHTIEIEKFVGMGSEEFHEESTVYAVKMDTIDDLYKIVKHGIVDSIEYVSYHKVKVDLPDKVTDDFMRDLKGYFNVVINHIEKW